MTKDQANQLLASIVAEIEAGTLYVEDIGHGNIERLLQLTRLGTINLDTADNRRQAIETALEKVVMPWLAPGNRLMSILTDDCDCLPSSVAEAVDSSAWVEVADGDDMETHQYWIVNHERLRLLMAREGCKIVQIEDLHIWCNPSSEVFGCAAIMSIGRMICAGEIDTEFNRMVVK
jgi:hypothetical protein